MLTGLVGLVEAVFKGVLAGVAALFTFSGTDTDRLFWVAVVFGVCIYAGASLCGCCRSGPRRCPCAGAISAWRRCWGSMFSAGIALLAAAAVLPADKRGRHRLEDHFRSAAAALHRRGERAPVSDQAGVRRLHRDGAGVLDDRLARLIAILISVNVLSGFVSALYAALIATGVRRAEETLLP